MCFRTSSGNFGWPPPPRGGGLEWRLVISRHEASLADFILGGARMEEAFNPSLFYTAGLIEGLVLVVAFLGITLVVLEVLRHDPLMAQFFCF